MTGLFIDNFLAWGLQVLVIGSVGALLPIVFRIREPRSHLIYCHMLLAGCLVLPLVQPWLDAPDRTVAITTEVTSLAGQAADAGGMTTPIAWGEVFLWILAIGALARLSWLLAGCWRISRYRRSATPLYPVPTAMTTARKLTGSDAIVCVSPDITGPVTFGVFAPVILLPKSFKDMAPEAQTGILCHELIHVRRRDWLVTILEEVYASLLWFHPAVWWLLSQTRLVREQLVDAEVIRVTPNHEPYINALLEIAGARPTLDLAPAPLFLRRRHLAERMRSLLTEVTMSKRQLLTSYAMIIAIITLAGWTALVSFPLTGQAEVPKAVQEPDEPAGDVGFVVSLDPIRYPATAVEAGILGEVVVELTFNLDGVVTDSRVLSGPEELRQTALRSALREEYEVSSARTLQVVVPFVTGTPPPPNPDQAEVLRVASAVSQENLIEQAPPRYPQAAREERIQGLVRLETRIDPEGNVTEARVLEGDQLLAAAARVAVLQWKYKPTLLNGQPIGITTTVNVNFSLN